MHFVHRETLPLTPAEAFERLRHYERLYPLLHAAHEPSAPAPAPLRPDTRFEVAERFGLERRVYRFRVSRYTPVAALTLEAEVETRFGPLRVPSRLTVAFELAAERAGCVLTIDQRVSFGRAWLDRLLAPRWLWRGVARHADEECRAAIALLLADEHFPPAAVS